MKSSRFPSFFSPRKPKQFDYHPRYYDPEKEQLEEQVARAKGRNKSRKRREVNMRHEFRSMRNQKELVKDQRKRMLRLGLIFAGLVVLFYLLSWFG